MKETADSGNLDLLRAIAVTVVFFDHFLHFVTGRTTDLEWHLGQLGVLMFFVHTSLVLMFSLERSDCPGPALCGSFYVRRFCRIYPLSIMAVLAVFLTQFPAGYVFHYPAWTRTELFANASLTQNLFFQRDMINVLWSLPLEVQMYVLLPILFLVFRKRHWSSVLCLWLLSLPAAYWQIRHASRLSVVSYVPCFVGGIVAWRLWRTMTPRLSGWLWPGCIALVSGIWLADGESHRWFVRWIFCLVLGMAIPCFREIQSVALKTAAKQLATYSYGVYLSHQPIMMLSFVIIRQPVVRWLVFVTLIPSVPYTLYHLIERPGIRLGVHLSRAIA